MKSLLFGSAAKAVFRQYKSKSNKLMSRIYNEVSGAWTGQIEGGIPYLSFYEDVDGNPGNGFEEIFITKHGQNELETLEIRITDYDRNGKNDETKIIKFYTARERTESDCKEVYLETALKNILKGIRERKKLLGSVRIKN